MTQIKTTQPDPSGLRNTQQILNEFMKAYAHAWNLDPDHNKYISDQMAAMPLARDLLQEMNGFRQSLPGKPVENTDNRRLSEMFMIETNILSSIMKTRSNRKIAEAMAHVEAHGSLYNFDN